MSDLHQGGILERSSGEWDEDGYHVRIVGSDGDLHVRVVGTEEARQLLEVVEGLRDWVAEHDHEYAAYLAASPEDRLRVLGLAVFDDAAELLRQQADHARKAAKENP